MSGTIDLRDRVSLVTGGSRGIGRAIALALAEVGSAVAVNFHRHDQAASEVAAMIQATGRRAIAIPADVSDRGQVDAMIQRVESEIGAVDVLINNAGVATIRGLDDLSDEEFDRSIAVNLKSAFLCTQAVLPSMRARQWGRIVNISSLAARGGGAIGVHYNAAKAGLEGLTRGYAARLAAEGITVNAVAPGLIDTDMTEPLTRNGRSSSTPVGRTGTAGEVAQAVVMLVQNGFITGQTTPVNGGLLFI